MLEKSITKYIRCGRPLELDADLSVGDQWGELSPASRNEARQYPDSTVHPASQLLSCHKPVSLVDSPTQRSCLQPTGTKVEGEVDNGREPALGRGGQYRAVSLAVPAHSPFFSQRILDQVVLKHLLGQQLLEARVLRLQFLESLGARHARAAELATPQVGEDLAEPVPPAQALRRRAGSASCRKPMMCSSEKRFLTSSLRLVGDWTPNHRAAQNRARRVLRDAARFRLPGVELMVRQ